MPESTGPKSSRRRIVAGNVAVPIVAAAVPTAIFQLPNVVPTEWKTIAIVIGLVVLAIVVAIQVRRGIVAAADIATTEDAINDYRIAVKRAFGPYAVLLAEMANQTSSTRKAQLPRLGDRAAVSLADYLMRHIPDVRAVVFALDDKLSELSPISQGGAGDPPGTFVRGTGVASDSNIDWVIHGGPPRTVADTDQQYSGETPPPYRSFVSVVIRSGDYSYGMLSVDSSEPHAFTSTDVETVKVMASFLAVAFALAYPGRSRPTSS